jgi:integrase
VPKKKIKDFTVPQVKQLLAGASPRTTLYLCLGLNCGMTQTDIASLRRDEINLAAGTITRKRTKTEQYEDVPEVTYKLWKPTRELLQQHIATEGDLALVGEGGRPLLSVTLDKKTDAVRSAFARLLKKTKIRGTFRMLRKTSAGLLENSAWNKLVDLFLGHTAAKISDKDYAKEALGRLAHATAWLAKKYGV